MNVNMWVGVSGLKQLKDIIYILKRVGSRIIIRCAIVDAHAILPLETLLQRNDSNHINYKPILGT